MRHQTRLAVLSALALGLSSLSPLRAQNSFPFMQTGFTQTLFGNAPSFFGGVGFAPNADVWVDDCAFGGSPLFRFAAATTVSDGHGGVEHPLVTGSPFASNAGCGMTNHPDGTLYSNTGAGVVNLDANTGAQLRPAFGPPGNVLGIAVDPQTNSLVYAKSDCRFTATCTIVSVDPVSLTSTTLAVLSPSDSEFIDGIFFDPSGNFIFLSNRAPVFRMTVLSRTGAIVQHVAMTSEPDGIAFHTNPTFVVTNNTNGTMTRFDFPSNNFALAPTQSLFASGGFRGDLSQVGPNGCLYVTQAGTRFVDNSTSSNNSVVQICPNFVPPPGVNPATGFMTGGGSVSASDGSRVTHGFTLQCNIKNSPDNLQINWGSGNSFHLAALSAVVCFNDPAINPEPPSAGFNTMVGRGTGTLNGVAGASVTFTFSDAGEPGRNDTAKITVQDAGGNTVLSASGNLTGGNQQAHQ